MLTSFPVLYTVPGFARVAVPAMVGAVAGAVQARFSFPAACEVTGLLVLPADGASASLAPLSLEILDDHDEQLFTDLIGNTANGREPFAVPCLSMAGRGFHPFPLSRLVKSGARWMMALKNFSGAPITVAAVSIHHRPVQP